jgi:myo-inositol catabolism protein IolC
MSNVVDERETSLIIDHAIGRFHITSNRVSLANHLRRLAADHKLDIQVSEDHVTLSNVPVSLLAKLQLATHCKYTGSEKLTKVGVA